MRRARARRARRRSAARVAAWALLIGRACFDAAFAPPSPPCGVHCRRRRSSRPRSRARHGRRLDRALSIWLVAVMPDSLAARAAARPAAAFSAADDLASSAARLLGRRPPPLEPPTTRPPTPTPTPRLRRRVGRRGVLLPLRARATRCRPSPSRARRCGGAAAAAAPDFRRRARTSSSPSPPRRAVRGALRRRRAAARSSRGRRSRRRCRPCPAVLLGALARTPSFTRTSSLCCGPTDWSADDDDLERCCCDVCGSCARRRPPAEQALISGQLPALGRDVDDLEDAHLVFSGSFTPRGSGHPASGRRRKTRAWRVELVEVDRGHHRRSERHLPFDENADSGLFIIPESSPVHARADARQTIPCRREVSGGAGPDEPPRACGGSSCGQVGRGPKKVADRTGGEGAPRRWSCGCRCPARCSSPTTQIKERLERIQQPTSTPSAQVVDHDARRRGQRDDLRLLIAPASLEYTREYEYTAGGVTAHRREADERASGRGARARARARARALSRERRGARGGAAARCRPCASPLRRAGSSPLAAAALESSRRMRRYV